MATKKAPTAKTDTPKPVEKGETPDTTVLFGSATSDPINPAIDPNATAEERLAALEAQHKVMAER